MNLNANRTVESFEIDEDQEIFNFYFDFVETTFGDMPIGFTSEYFKVNLTLEKYFKNNKNLNQWWSF